MMIVLTQPLWFSKTRKSYLPCVVKIIRFPHGCFVFSITLFEISLKLDPEKSDSWFRLNIQFGIYMGQKLLCVEICLTSLFVINGFCKQGDRRSGIKLVQKPLMESPLVLSTRGVSQGNTNIHSKKNTVLIINLKKNKHQ